MKKLLALLVGEEQDTSIVLVILSPALFSHCLFCYPMQFI